ALSLPRQGGLTLAKELYEGMFPLAKSHDVAIAGGDTSSWDGPLVVSVTLVGDVTSHGVVRRDGGRVGDQLLVTGTLGGSILGKQFDFDPRVDEALWLNAHAELHAAMDISDGLALDLSRLAAASNCGAVVDLASVPVSDAARQLAARGEDEKTSLDHALSDGEDFELLLAVPSGTAQSLLDTQPLGVCLTRIGELVAERGLWQQTSAGRSPLAAVGFEHRLTP
ncbi:MAG: thiamine-monophosphate kinase, partial [Pirellulales bacterium]